MTVMCTGEDRKTELITSEQLYDAEADRLDFLGALSLGLGALSFRRAFSLAVLLVFALARLVARFHR